jgi:hypothetical protein
MWCLKAKLTVSASNVFEQDWFFGRQQQPPNFALEQARLEIVQAHPGSDPDCIAFCSLVDFKRNRIFIPGSDLVGDIFSFGKAISRLDTTQTAAF